MKNIAVIGAGSWGTALAITLGKNGHNVKIWDVDTEHLKNLQADGENKKYLPGCKFVGNMQAVFEAKDAIEGADVVLFSAPAQHFRSALDTAFPYLTKDMIIVNVSKGIEQKTLMRMSEIAKEKLEGYKYAVLAGPSHAEEVGQAYPTIIAAAADDINVAEEIQDIFMNEHFRVYTNDDVIGSELGGALKNIIALGAGISDGMGFGDNAKAALMARGMVEIKRLGIALGAKEETFNGVTGIGDLIVTCISMHSRNRRCGIMIGEGMAPAEAIKEVGMVVEGIYTAEAAFQLAQKVGVEMPITEAICAVINGKLDGRVAVEPLMGRERKNERLR